jgi:hypothetical protein
MARVFNTTVERDAHLKVFLAAKATDADLLYYQVEREKDARGDVFWFFTENEKDAKTKLFWVDRERDADLRVFQVHKETEAAWRTSHKWRERLG